MFCTQTRCYGVVALCVSLGIGITLITLGQFVYHDEGWLLIILGYMILGTLWLVTVYWMMVITRLWLRQKLRDPQTINPV